jgi:hypothetical protein
LYLRVVVDTFARSPPLKSSITFIDSHNAPRIVSISIAAAFGIGILAAILTLPALWAPEGTVVPVAFFAVTSVTVIGLFLSFLIPIYLRWRMGDKFKQGSWNLGNKWKWMAPIAIVEIIFITIVLCLPTTPAGVPGNEAFTWKAVQYAPLAILFVIGAAMLWWQLSAKKWFTGPKIVN